jgi:hypothetical protein
MLGQRPLQWVVTVVTSPGFDRWSRSSGASIYTVGKIVSDVGEFLIRLLVSRWLGTVRFRIIL